MLPHRSDQQPLSSIPNSLRQQLERAQLLLDQGKEAGAMEVLVQVAQQCPELAATVILADSGSRGLEVEVVERIDQYQTVPRTFLGLKLKDGIINVPTIKRRTIRARLL